MRRLPGRCAYCGAAIRSRKLACAGHADLPELDPHYTSLHNAGPRKRAVVDELVRAREAVA